MVLIAGLPRAAFAVSYVGIGTTSPGYPLVVSGGAGSGQTQGAAEFNNGGGDAGVRISNTTAGGRTYTMFSSGTGSSIGVGNFNIYDATSGAARISIAQGGNVGIGTTNPGSLLHINGGSLTVQSPTQSGMMFRSAAGTGGFSMGRSAGAGDNNDFYIYDSAAGVHRLNINSSGNVGIGTTNPNSKLQVMGTMAIGTPGVGYPLQVEVASNVTALIWSPAAGVTGFGGINDATSGWNATYIYGTTVTLQNTSDIRLKKDIHDIDYSRGLDDLLRIRPVTYHWRDVDLDKNSGEKLGVIAQEVETVFPKLVSAIRDNTITLAGGKKEVIPMAKMVDYAGFTVPLIAAVKGFYDRWFKDSQQIHAALDQVRAENAELRQRNDELVEWICAKDPAAAFCH